MLSEAISARPWPPALRIVPEPSAMKVYAADHPISRAVTQAFARGSGGQIVPIAVPAGTLADGPAAVYGILRGCDTVIRQCEWVGRDFHHIDLGYFGRGHYDGYYRVTRNGFQHAWRGRDYPDDRLRALGVGMSPWRSGRHVLVCPVSRNWADFEGFDSASWLRQVIAEIPRHTDRPVVVKPKGDGTLAEALRGCHMVVTYNSNAAIEALAAGVPVCTLGNCAASPLSTPLRDIENPRRGDREGLFRALAYQQWTLREFADGTCWGMLNEFD